MKTKYEVIWIDDEWDKMDAFKEECEVIHNIILHPFKTRKAGMEEFDMNPQKWDAIILDAKVLDETENETPKLVGLRKAKEHIEKKSSIRRVPYFIFTGQPDLMDNEIFGESYGSFYVKGRDDAKLIEDIKEKAGNYTRYQIKELYCDYVEMLFDLNQDVCDNILKILETMHYPNSHPDFTPRHYYNPLRQALEYVFRTTRKIDLIPDEFFPGSNINLNQCFMYVIGKEASKLGYKHGGGSIVPRHIQDMMSLIVNLGNANSHSIEPSHSTELSDDEIQEYEIHIKNTGANSKILLFSMALQFYEILQWANNYIKEHQDKEANKKNWIHLTINEETEKKSKEGNEEGVIERDENGYYHIGDNYSVFLNRKELLGKKVKIISYKDNTNEKTKNLYKRFVLESDLEVLGN